MSYFEREVNMKFGMPTLVELKTLEENVALCHELGLDFVEINMNFPQFQLNALDENNLKTLADTYGVFFTFHLAEDLDIAHNNPRIRQAYYDEIAALVVLMEAIGSPLMNMHLCQGIKVTLPTEKIWLYETYIEDYKTKIVTFNHFAEQLLEGKTIKIMAENTGLGNKSFINAAIDILCQSPVIGLTWDIGHDHSSGYCDEPYLMKHFDKIRHYHFHDAIESQNHMTLFDGQIDINRFYKDAKEKDASVVLETKTVDALKESVKRLKEKELML